MEIKNEEKKEDVAKLEGALSLLEEKKKKLNWRLLISKACVMLMFLHYFVENLQVPTFVCFIIYLVVECLYFFPSLVFSQSFRRLIYWLRWLLLLINLNQLKSTFLTEL